VPENASRWRCETPRRKRGWKRRFTRTGDSAFYLVRPGRDHPKTPSTSAGAFAKSCVASRTSFSVALFPTDRPRSLYFYLFVLGPPLPHSTGVTCFKDGDRSYVGRLECLFLFCTSCLLWIPAPSKELSQPFPIPEQDRAGRPTWIPRTPYASSLTVGFPAMGPCWQEAFRYVSISVCATLLSPLPRSDHLYPERSQRLYIVPASQDFFGLAA
jgi:hypothetical protein